MNGRLYQVYAYLLEMHLQAFDASRSPFLIDDHDDFVWFAEYYESGLNLVAEIIADGK